METNLRNICPKCLTVMSQEEIDNEKCHCGATVTSGDLITLEMAKMKQVNGTEYAELTSTKRKGSLSGTIIKALAVIFAILGGYCSLAAFANVGKGSVAFAALCYVIIFSLLTYAVGEVCSILAEIRDRLNEGEIVIKKPDNDQKND